MLCNSFFLLVLIKVKYSLISVINVSIISGKLRILEKVINVFGLQKVITLKQFNFVDVQNSSSYYKKCEQIYIAFAA